jgi:hypothetical protein
MVPNLIGKSSIDSYLAVCSIRRPNPDTPAEPSTASLSGLEARFHHGIAGCHAAHHRHVRNGHLQRLQADEGIWHPRGSGCSARKTDSRGPGPATAAASGSIAGLGLGVLASRLLAQIVYEATPHDPLVLGGTMLTTALLGLLATWIPATAVRVYRSGRITPRRVSTIQNGIDPRHAPVSQTCALRGWPANR